MSLTSRVCVENRARRSDPSNVPTSVAGAGGERIASIDFGRGLAVLLMVFTNELEVLSGTPSWLRHVDSPVTDLLTIRDFGLGAFLFLVGVSLPLTIERRLARYETRGRILAHIAARSLALLGLGVLLVNADRIRNGGRGWPPGLWGLVALFAVLAASGRMPARWRFGREITLVNRALGVTALLWLAWAFRGPGGERLQFPTPLSQELGLIGISYLVAGTLLLMVRQSKAGMVGSLAVLISLHLAMRRGRFEDLALNKWIDVGAAFGSLPSIAVGGAVAWALFYSKSSDPDPIARLRSGIAFGIWLALAAMLLHPFGGINAIQATPAWALWCCALSCWLLTFFHWLFDLRGMAGWARVLSPIGSNALIAYLLPSFLYAAGIYLGLPSMARLTGDDFLVGSLGCAAYTVLVMSLVILLPRIGIRIGL